MEMHSHIVSKAAEKSTCFTEAFTQAKLMDRFGEGAAAPRQNVPPPFARKTRFALAVTMSLAVHLAWFYLRFQLEPPLALTLIGSRFDRLNAYMSKACLAIAC